MYIWSEQKHQMFTVDIDQMCGELIKLAAQCIYKTDTRMRPPSGMRRGEELLYEISGFEIGG